MKVAVYPNSLIPPCPESQTDSYKTYISIHVAGAFCAIRYSRLVRYSQSLTLNHHIKVAVAYRLDNFPTGIG